MNILGLVISILSVIIFGIIMWYTELHLNIKEPVVFYVLGFLSGVVCMLLQVYL